MRKLVLKMSMSIDSFIGGPNGEVDWLFRNHDDAQTAWQVARLWEAGLHIMGSRTFQDMKAWWPQSDEPYAPPMNAIPKAYFSRGGTGDASTTKALKDAKRQNPGQTSGQAVPTMESWNQAPKLTGDLALEIKKLKAEDGKPIIAYGGAGFARSLIATGLIDEYQLLVYPIALGAGLAVFSGLAKPLHLKLHELRHFKSGTVAKVYQAA